MEEFLANAKGYLFGFNGKERDNETYGEGNVYDYGFRIYNPRIGKFLSTDPLSPKYPWYTPYQFAGNYPTFAMDIDGLEPDKILNKAELLLNTPYEFGGKNPSRYVIGLLGTEKGRKIWTDQLLLELRKISNMHPTHYKPQKNKGEECSDEDEEDQFNNVVQSTYETWEKWRDGNHSLGIDCSGFVFACYKEDKQLLMTVKALNTGSSGQLAAFKSAMKVGQAYVHKNFNLISKGDFIYKPGHVMIATGNVRVNEKGEIVAFETIEANDTDHGTIKMWRSIDKKYTIAHPLRIGDKTSNSSCTGDQQVDQCDTLLQQLELNLDQTIVPAPTSTK